MLPYPDDDVAVAVPLLHAPPDGRLPYPCDYRNPTVRPERIDRSVHALGASLLGRAQFAPVSAVPSPLSIFFEFLPHSSMRQASKGETSENSLGIGFQWFPSSTFDVLIEKKQEAINNSYRTPPFPLRTVRLSDLEIRSVMAVDHERIIAQDNSRPRFHN